MLPVLADLARDHRVLAPDVPGFGASEAPHVVLPLGLVRRLGGGLPGPHVEPRRGAGRQLDGWPDRARGRPLAPAVGTRAGAAGPLAGLPAPAAVRPFVRLVQPAAGPAADAGAVPPPRHRVDQGHDERARTGCPRPGTTRRPTRRCGCFRSPAHRAAFFTCARQIYLEEAHGRQGFWDRLPGLAPPALFIWGDRDRLVPASFARHVSNALPEAASIVMEDSRARPQFEHPELTAALSAGSSTRSERVAGRVVRHRGASCRTWEIASRR